MTLPAILGKSSADKPFVIDLIKMPHLFVSYTEEVQVQALFASIFEGLSINEAAIEIMLGSSKRGAHLNSFKPNNFLVKHCFIPEEDVITLKTREAFMIAISKEMRDRRMLMKRRQKKVGSDKSTSAPMIVILDDVLQFILSRKKSVGLIFLELLLEGPQLNMHLVAISAGTYHNLLKQLLTLNPLVQERFYLLKRFDGINTNVPLGAELVITGDDFLFFKEVGDTDYHRLYPPYERRVAKETIDHEEIHFKPLGLIYT